MRPLPVFALSLGVLVGCAKRQSVADCAPEAWVGECELVSVAKVEDKEFPIPHVVFEASYRPLPNASYPRYTPGPVSERTLVKSQYELPLADHLEAHGRVACSLPQAPSGSCPSAKVKLAVPVFNSDAADRAAEAPPVVGCAQIESTAAQDRVRVTQQTQTVVSQRFRFAEGSAELSPDADALGKEVAATLAAKPQIECLGVVGQIAAGESPGLAERRAQAIRDLLAVHGVPLTRLLTIGATAKVFGNGSKPSEPDPADRRVGFSVLLERAPQP